MEAGRQRPNSPAPPPSGPVWRVVDCLRHRLPRLWGAFIVPLMGVIAFFGVAYLNVHRAEEVQLLKAARNANDAAVEHCRQAANQVDTLLHAARGYYLQTRSLADTGTFIQSLGFDRSLIDEIRLVTADGRVAIAASPAALGLSVADRDDYAVHRAGREDRLFISAVEGGRMPGQRHFYLSRRIAAPDDGFGGLVLAAVNPDAFTDDNRNLTAGTRNFAALLGLADRKLRARIPAPSAEQWSQPIESPLWDALKQASSGQFEDTNPIDQVRRVQVFKQVPGLPLVMVTGLSTADWMQGVHRRMLWFPVAFAVIVGFTFLLALLLTREAKRRDEQERFMSMLNHELKTPLSVIGLALGCAGLPAATQDRVARAVSDMNAIIERCLQSDRLRQGPIKPIPAPCQVAGLLAQVKEDLGASPRLRIHAAPLPTCTTDSELLAVILRNLCDNALKYGSPEEAVTVAAAPASWRRRPGIRILVANTSGACGMPDPQRVFKKYYRAPGAHGKTGSGLGLHIAQGFAQALGGWLHYRPAHDEVRFELWIPV
ncbi:ATP-binding protein [uncultured Thiodictyon sp.]|uniref:sensor histidine kinase n=1 Tax=uncultured Thiodictyon sp. TaxID=1846217 RepID=UPI0025EED06F|nr:ATP-binding protein [uncultured Thiodictyon sp.]